jgi:hypothetical protein
MLEQSVEKFFSGQAAAEPPPALVSIGQAIQAGRRQTRRRRIAAAGVPLAAAAAVTAVALASAPPAARPSRPAASPSRPAVRPPVTGPAAPAAFSPDSRDLEVSPLPAGWKAGGEVSADTVQVLLLLLPSHRALYVTVFAAGQCRVAGAQLRCASVATKSLPTATTRAPDIDGRVAYWDSRGGVLVFQYARSGWGYVSGPTQADDLRAARRVVVAAAGPAARFPVRLTGLPGWAVTAVATTVASGGPRAFMFELVPSAAVNSAALRLGGFGIDPLPNLPLVAVYPASPCPSDFGDSEHEIAGHEVAVSKEAAEGDQPATESLCADADGLQVFVTVSGNHPVLDVTFVFAHLRLLGGNPARWTTRPVSQP